jgi:CheY-like chemotaxis protein
MKTPLSALVIEDSADDYELLVRELKRAGYEVQATRVESAKDMRNALENKRWDIVFSDSSMPGFSARDALGVLKSSTHDVPFVITSGTLQEEVVTACLKAGASDFVLKGRNDRLLLAVERLMADSKERARRLRLIEELWVADRLASVGAIACSVSRDLDDALSALVPNLELASRELASDGASVERLRSEVKDALTAAERACQVVADLALLSFPSEAGPGLSNLEPVLAAALRMTRSEYAGRAKVERGETCSARVAIAPAKLTQLLASLVSSATQLLKPGGTDNGLRLSTSMHEAPFAELRLEVRGAMVPAEVVRALGEQGPSTAAATIALGLGFCQSVAYDSGGALRAESVGSTLTFVLTLPLSE